ncbi:MAG: tRNA (N6-isopentenyl adenosine(37)-C2)-methylthiotransferase MiaB [Candidatus Aureabacteria bacterium]|nr:tRNA (N6-isopentenyl adenosine(37)-C2)-methylthiotransferase MiaB [Candidatus Auribacterota bacterium]
MSDKERPLEPAPRKVHLRTYGCQMNEYDSEVIAGLFERDGWVLTDDESQANVILLNTCSVRQHAEDRVWGALFELRERAMREPGLIIGVCGCMAQAKAQEIARRCPHVKVICGTRAFNRLPELVARAAEGRGMVIDIDMSREPCLAGLPKRRRSRLKAFVPVMRGCENYCAYCVVPYVRGHEVSRSLKEVLAEVESLAREGCREVMLLGQNVNSYRAGGVSFSALLREVAAIKGIDRIRFMTSHPKDFSDELIRAMAEVPQVCEHLHLPLQSGSDKTLKVMNRGYTFESYRGLAQKIREAVPEISLSTDILVGFPGETDDDFNQTARALDEIGFDSAFIFKYSDREGTRAYELQPKVGEAVVVQRHAELLKLQEKIGMEKNKKLLGASLEVLVEGYSPRNPERLFGRTGTNKRVVFEGSGDLIGKFVYVIIREATPLTLIGEAV